MNLKDYISDKALLYEAEAADMNGAIDLLVDLHESAGNLNDREKFRQAVLRRESEQSTLLCEGIAAPHAHCDAVKRASLACIRLRAPVSWHGKEVSRIYMLASPDSKAHLELLSALADALQNGNDIV